MIRALPSPHESHIRLLSYFLASVYRVSVDAYIYIYIFVKSVIEEP